MSYIIWGESIKQDLFERWSQGFIFNNEKEPTALLQYQGGPCTVITAVQAYLLRELLFCSKCGENWRRPTEEELNTHLTDSLLSIFINVCSENLKYLIFYENTPELKVEDLDDDSASSNAKRVKLDYDAFIKKLKYSI